MTEKDPMQYPSIITTDAGTPGMVNVHDQATGTTIIAEADVASVMAAVHELNNR
jgi:hypothetical protein